MASCGSPGRTRRRFQPGSGLLGYAVRPVHPITVTVEPAPALPIPIEALHLSLLLRRVELVPAGVPRPGASRRGEILLTRVIGGRQQRWRPTAPMDRVTSLAAAVANLTYRNDESFVELVGLAKQLGIASEIVVQVYPDPRTNLPPDERRDIAAVIVDGINIGLLSDGTLRVLGIIVELLGPSSALLLIEEPETAVHPGLLSRLLSVLDSYSSDRQIVLSTHSPLVVSACSPEELRLVTRTDGPWPRRV